MAVSTESTLIGVLLIAPDGKARMSDVADKRVKDAIEGVRFAESIAKQIVSEATRKLRVALLDSQISVKDQAAILNLSPQRIYQLRKGTRI